ncbi:site-specific integrase [Adlercreutzia sp. ZJ138]|uniref:tyrosine-type recombinase/integrase n=1 Tax=Adlercreutzia sp. ZJ138 TaxID=2709405 RepID=UPI0013EA15D4|nr:site-specific integrase [Adlercreutzia sp. ZJ138]
MAEKTNGKGSIFQLDKGKDGKKPKSKCRKWRLVVSLGKDPHTGKYRQKAKNFDGTYTQAQRELRVFVSQIEGGTLIKRSGWTFYDYAEHYVSARIAAGEIQERTASNMRSSLNALAYRIGGLKLQEITPDIIEAAYIDLRAGKSLSGKPLSGRTLYNINLAAFLMFQSAKDKGIVGENPLEKVPAPKKDTKEKASLTAAAYSSLIASLDPAQRMQCAVLLCAALGLRRSESLGLSWGDVDFEGGTVNVHASTDEHAALKEPKTEAGFRLLPMPEQLASALMKRKAAVVRTLAKYHPELLIPLDLCAGVRPAGCVEVDGQLYDVDGKVAVCCNDDGERPQPQALSKWWSRHCKKYGLEGWTLHSLRHSFLSLAAAQGVHPSVMMHLAGHKSPDTTLKIYTHVNMKSKREAMDVIQKAYMLAG